MTDVILLDAPDTHTKKRQVMYDMIQTAAKHYGREEREGVTEGGVGILRLLVP